MLVPREPVGKARQSECSSSEVWCSFLSDCKGESWQYSPKPEAAALWKHFVAFLSLTPNQDVSPILLPVGFCYLHILCHGGSSHFQNEILWRSINCCFLIPLLLMRGHRKCKKLWSWGRAESALYPVSGDLDNREDPLTAPSPPFLVHKRKRLKMLFKVVYSPSLYLPTVHQVFLVHVTNFFLLAYCVPAAL